MNDDTNDDQGVLLFRRLEEEIGGGHTDNTAQGIVLEQKVEQYGTEGDVYNISTANALLGILKECEGSPYKRITNTGTIIDIVLLILSLGKRRIPDRGIHISTAIDNALTNIYSGHDVEQRRRIVRDAKYLISEHSIQQKTYDGIVTDIRGYDVLENLKIFVDALPKRVSSFDEGIKDKKE